LSLQVDAMIAPCAANYSIGNSTVFGKMLRQGGQDFRAELRHLDPCRSGEVRVVKAYGLPCSKLLVTVGPKYKEKYQVAGENSLNSCCRESMQAMLENELRSVAIPCCWYTKGFVLEDHAHIVLRTLRRCLERLRQSIDVVVLVGETALEVELYDALLPSYFPRTVYEAKNTARSLSESCWNPWGEVIVEERRIPLSDLLTRNGEGDSDTECAVGGPLFSAAEDEDKSFLQAKDDADKITLQRLETTLTDEPEDDVARQVCMRYIRRAQEMSLDGEPESCRFVYGAGCDRFGRHVVVILGARLPSLGVREERTLPRFVRELEDLHGEKFVLLYANSAVATADTVILEVLQEMMSVAMTVKRYHDNFAQLYVLHPGIWFRAAFALGSWISNVAAKVWSETIYCETIAEMSLSLDIPALRLPSYVHACDGSVTI